ncbi:MltR family transcriptional regulator [Viridibacillus sp. FSL R5-0468]|uniref:MltR family transcriptional regulator n=1 Tax=Viridibacillus sp. FSL R5-0468 TaxID=2921640 RepID=UPI0030FAE438
MTTITKRNYYTEYLLEFQKEAETSSDRGIVLISLSILDEMLTNLLKTKFIANEKHVRDMFSTKGPMGQLDDKIKTAYALGLTSEVDNNLLIKLQRVRNKFAHKVTGISFDDDSISNICSNITLPKNAFIPLGIPLMGEGETEFPKVDLNPVKKDTKARDRFIFAFYFLFSELGDRITFSFEEKVESVTGFASYSKVIEKMQTNMEKSSNFKIEYDRKLLLGKLHYKEIVAKTRMKMELEVSDEQKKYNEAIIEESQEKILTIEREREQLETEFQGFSQEFESMVEKYLYFDKVIENSKID